MELELSWMVLSVDFRLLQQSFSVVTLQHCEVEYT